mgnify:CR=1 FL=1
MIPFPDISPTLFEIDIGPIHFALRWYALAYIAGIVIAGLVIYIVVSGDTSTDAPVDEPVVEVNGDG